MDEKKLWLKISGSINYYLQYYSKRMTNEELLNDYLEYALPDMDGDGVHTYLDKQTLERVDVGVVFAPTSTLILYSLQ